MKHDEAPPWRMASRGRCFVYLLPCFEMDVAKIGFSTDPVSRMARLHHRYYRYFDLERAILLEVEHVREARVIEAALKLEFAGSAVPAPLAVASTAGGRYEWFAGAADAATGRLIEYSNQLGYPLHLSIAAWLREQWRDSSATLFDWSAQLLERAELVHFNANDGVANVYARRLHDVISLCNAIGLSLPDRFPESVLNWNRYGFCDAAPR